jgi:hypothetical protein
VIATGFGPQAATRPVASAAQTPVDMSHYADHARLRADSGAAAVAASASSARLSIARRPLLDLSSMVSAGAPAASVPAVAASGPAAAPAPAAISSAPTEPPADFDDMRKLDIDPDFDLGSTFDVPAFLRRQEG